MVYGVHPDGGLTVDFFAKIILNTNNTQYKQNFEQKMISTKILIIQIIIQDGKRIMTEIHRSNGYSYVLKT